MRRCTSITAAAAACVWLAAAFSFVCAADASAAIPIDQIDASGICAVPGQDPAPNATGVVNAYWAGSSNLAIAATSLVLGEYGGGTGDAVAIGDLLMVIQMQDGEINPANNVTYGDGLGNGKGTTTVGSAGLHEFVRVDGIAGGPGAGGTVTFTPALTNAYVQAPATPTSGQKRYQVVRVPQFAAVTLAGVSAPHWAIAGANSAETGGVVVVDVQGTLTLGAGTVENIPNRAIFVAGRGFRGAAGRQAQSNGGESDWVSVGPSDGNGGKGEGIAGTPRYVSFKTNDFGVAVPNAADLVVIDSGVEGYPAGDRARGAPGNAGGGGSDGDVSGTARNAGGGGGGNYAAGGLGGRPWDAPTNDTNGRGGAGYAGTLAFNRVFLGGGGGGGGTNDGTSDGGTYENAAVGCGIGAGVCSSGASGGGIVILRARSITGSGIIDVRGAPGYNVGNDAAGGGGAAGSVVLHTVLGGSATVIASGGDGGNAWAGAGGGEGARHGPGGGGGGGLVAYAPTAMAVTADVAGGAPGRTTNGVGDTYEASGFVGGIVTFLPPDVPGIDPGAECGPVLRLAKTNFTDTVVAGSGTTYQLTVSNTGTSATTGTIQVSDFLAEGLSIAPGAVALSGPNAANWACNASGSLITCSSAVVIGPGAASAFAFTATVGASATHTTNRASVGGGGGSENPNPVDPSTCTGNNTPIGCAVDTDTANAPLLVLEKSHLDPVVAGQSAQYTLAVTNTGSLATSGVITIVDALPAGMSFLSGGGNGFTCSAIAQVVTCVGSPTIAPAGSVSFPLNVLIAADAAQVLTNRAQVGGGGDPSKPAVPTGSSAAACPAPVPPATSLSEPSTGCASETVTIRRVHLVLDKTDGSASVSIGGQTTYQLTVRNTGDTASLGTIELRDVLPTPFTWAAPLGPVVPTGANATDWTCTIASATTLACSSSVAIAAGGSSTFSLVADINAADAGTQYINRARIGGGGDADLVPGAPGDLEVGACTGSDVPRGCSLDLSAGQVSPRLRLAKTHADPQTVLPGGTVTFSLVVSNSSATASSGTITVIDVLPTGLTYVSATSMDGFTCTNAAQVVTCTSTNVLAGTASATITLVASVAANAAAILTNVGQVGGGGDPMAPTPTPTTTAQCIANGVPYAGCAIDTVPTVPDYDFCPASTSPRVFNVVNGVNIYGYTPGSATPDTLLPLKPQAMTGNLNALMVDPVNNRLLMVERSSSTSTTLWAYDSANGGWYVAAGPVVSPDFPRGGMALNGTGYLIAGGSATPAVWRVQAQAAPSFAYTLTAVGTLTYDVAPTDLGSGDIAIDGDGNGWIAVGQDLYRVNLTTFQATRQTRPSLGGSPSTINWAGIAFAPDGTLVLANNNSPSAYYQYNPATGVIVLRVNTTANSSRDLASCAFPTQPVPQLSAVKTLAQVNGAAPGAAVYPGDVLRYAITISNTGGAVATLYPGDIRETVPANTTVVVTGNDFTCTGSNCPNTNAVNVAAGASVTLYFVVQLDTPLPTTQISNAVTIPGQVNCANAPNDCNEVTPVGPRVTMTKTLQSGGPVAQPGGSLVYAITLTNLTGVPASIPAGAIGETVPLNTTHVAGDSFACAAPAAGSACSNAAAVAVAANGSSVLTFTVTVANPIPAGVTSIANTAVPPPGVTCPTCTVTTPTAPRVTLVKALTNESGAQAGVAEPGETLTYTITLANNGGTAFTNYDFVENVPNGATLSSVTGAGVTACATPVVGAGTCNVTVSSVPANASTIVTVVFTVANPLPAGTTSIVNLVSGGDTTCPVAGNTCSVTTPTAPRVTLVKALTNESGTQAGIAEPGETLTYTITLANNGGTAFTNYDFVENVPNGATLSSVTGAGVTACATPVVGAGTCNVTVASVPANASTTVTIVFTVANPLPAGTTSIVNLVSGGDTTCPVAGNTCSVTTPTAPRVTLVKALTNESGAQAGVAEPGETLTYTITLANNGGTAFTNYDFVENVPNGATLTSVTGTGVTACATPVVGAGPCNVTVASVPANASTTVTVVFTVADPLPAGTTSIVNLVNGGDTVCTAPNVCTVTTPTAPRVTLVKSLTSESGSQAGVAEPGETLTYTITLANNGGTAFANYDFVENVPNGATLSSVTGAGVTACPTPVVGAGTCNVTVASVPANASTTVTVVFTVADPLPAGTTSIVNLVSGGDTTCPVAGNTCSVTTPTAPRVTLVKSLTSESGSQAGVAEPGETLTYTITLANNGGTAFTNYDFVENVPNGATLSSVTGAGVTACPTPVVGAGTCNVTVASVPANASTTVTVVFTVANPLPAGTTSIVNLVSGGDTTCPQPGNTCSVTTAGRVAIAKTVIDASGNGIAEPGETLTWTITLSNSGGAIVTGYGLTDPLDVNTTFASASNGGIHAAGTVTWTNLSIPPQVGAKPGVLVLTVTTTVNTPIPDGVRVIGNLAHETGGTPPNCTVAPVPANCASIPTAASLTVAKALSAESITADGIAEPGEQLTYTITLRNHGGTLASNVIVNETVPLHTTFVSGAPTWSCAVGSPGGTACESVINVPPADAGGVPGVATLIFTVAVVDPLPTGVQQIANAVAIDDGTPPDCVATPSHPQCVVTPTINLSLVKSVESVTATGPGTYWVAYRIDIANTGGSPASYTLTDTPDFTPGGVTVTGNAIAATTSGTLNPALPGGAFTVANGTAVQISASALSLPIGATHSYTVRIPIAVSTSTLVNGACTGAPGNGLYNRASVQGSFARDSSACAPVSGEQALIRLVKTVRLGVDVNGDRYGNIGDVLNYTFVISNPGSVTLSTIDLIDPRVTDLQCDTTTAYGEPLRVLRGDELFFGPFEDARGGQLEPGDSILCGATYTITAQDVLNRRVVNTATTHGAGSGGQVVTSTSTAIYTNIR
jgi:uncharacterized repeat protein (TIGR01451 family)